MKKKKKKLGMKCHLTSTKKRQYLATSKNKRTCR